MPQQQETAWPEMRLFALGRFEHCADVVLLVHLRTRRPTFNQVLADPLRRSDAMRRLLEIPSLQKQTIGVHGLKSSTLGQGTVGE